ncbi:MAG: hypothetical protein KAW17_10785, partial [Candidatus Eisenbacteria sp.]|nr:hypothetical protein [Candidatus Eisenbacteria bacterium]
DGPPWEEYVMIPTEQQPGPAPWFEICRRNAERYTRHLSRGHIVIVGAGGEMILPHGRIGELEYELELLERFQDAGAEELEILSADFAREFLEAQD